MRTVARTPSGSRAASFRAVGSPSGSPASRSCRGRRSEASRSATPSASSPAISSSRARSRADGAPGGAWSAPSMVTVVTGPRRRSSRKATASGRPCRWASTTTATGRPENRWAAPALSTAVSHGPAADTGARSAVISGAAARTSRTTRARPTAMRLKELRPTTPRIAPQPPTGTVGGCGGPLRGRESGGQRVSLVSVRRRGGAGDGARAPTAHPRCRTARRWRARTRGTGP